MPINCPECGRKYYSSHSFASHWGHQHEGPTPDDIDTSHDHTPSGEDHPMHGVTGEDHPMYGKTGEDHPAYGHTKSHTEEAKLKISENHALRNVTGEDHPAYGYRSTTTTEVVEQTGHEVRSGWEKEVDLLLHQNDIEYEYESKTFDLNDRSYTPDFKIESVIVEVKGYKYKDPDERAHQFMDMYPEFTYIVIGTELPCDIHIDYEDREELLNYI